MQSRKRRVWPKLSSAFFPMPSRFAGLFSGRFPGGLSTLFLVLALAVSLIGDPLRAGEAAQVAETAETAHGAQESQGAPAASAAATARILTLGDSMMAWHGVSGASIADVLSVVLGEPVENRAIGGARIIYGLPITGAMGMKISKQYRGDKVDWVVINGGGNDLWLGCGCHKCDRKMARMIAADGTRGEIPRLVHQIRQTGANVVYLGYLRSPGVDSMIDACRDLGDEFEARVSAMAAQSDGVYFLDLSRLVPEGDRSFHGVDMIHPSKKGSRVIGEKLADLIRQIDKAR
ncbi:SGNH/GDSL hydrolase family protein [Celeribacter neptunius]|uniref:Lysophospholipase L1 n=1 Tax=Celeribacter neptunius TaxID=588602 RepID=A0A1I3RY50_9RHOB|nr:SGNH/GDSL hydrolase family protein [Celeribacter neptunius]SFJ51523.1 Lysophospholipase L1 [Celeribacter neptunius]